MHDTFSRPSAWTRSHRKRLVDVALAVVGLSVALPLLLVCGVAVVLTSRGGAFFGQERAGLDGATFRVIKLRTMKMVPVGTELEIPDSERLTRVGRFLRRLSLDELPQLWNVVTGDMSLVGPRPLPVRYVGRYSPEQRRRLLARPGLTGLAQVRGRNALGWDEKFRLDVEYVETSSLRMDLRILLLTVATVLGGGGVSASGHATMPEFTGGVD